MIPGFSAHRDPPDALCRNIAAARPDNPFDTPSYVHARRLGGEQAWVFLLESAEGYIAACAGFTRRGRLSGSLDIPSLPALPEGDEAASFWKGLEMFWLTQGCHRVTLGTFASEPVSIPPLAGLASRRARVEHIIDLADQELLRGLGSQHARKVRQSRKAGVEVRKGEGSEACRTHALLHTASMSRREARGEAVRAGRNVSRFEALIETGAGEIHEAILADRVLSSVLLLTAASGGYYYSSGSSAEGMATGSSHFLLHQISLDLQRRRFTRFNLGGAGPDNAGLVRFKTGFGTRTVELEAAEIVRAGPLRRALAGVARIARRTHRS